MNRHYDEHLNLFMEKKKEEERERIASEKAKQKREAEKAKAQEPKGAKVEEITEEEAKRIAEKNKAATEVPGDVKMEEAKKEEAGDEDDKTPPPLGNGGKTDKYVWTQTLTEVVINVPVPAETRAKMMSVSFGSKKIKAQIKGQPPIIDGEFPERIKVLLHSLS